MSTDKKGLMPGDDLSKYRLYSRGGPGVPERFHDHILIDMRKPFDHQILLNKGFYLNDLGRVVNRFNGISFELLGN
jgi:hypothetical protein